MSLVDLFRINTSKPSLITHNTLTSSYVLLGLAYALCAAKALYHGTPKPLAEIDWIDVLGEGGTWIISLVWFHFAVAWRPPGPVTRWLMAGFAVLSFGFFLDALDEVLRFDETLLGHSLESIFIPAGITILTFAAISLHQEQQILNRQQLRREANFRDHQAIDSITDLYNADYCRQAIHSAIESNTQLDLWMIDLERFDKINQHYSFSTGDTVLNRVANVLVATAPSGALVCRYGGDRFILLQPATDLTENIDETLSQLLTNATSFALSNLAIKNIDCRVRVAKVSVNECNTAEAVLAQANAVITEKKQC